MFLFLNLRLHWVFTAARGLSPVAASRGGSSCGVEASHRGGFSCCRAWTLQHAGFSNCGACAQMLWDMKDLSSSIRIKPALAGRFLTTEPPGKSRSHFFSEFVPLDCEPYKCFSVFFPLFPPSREMPRVGRPGYFTSSGLLQFSCSVVSNSL